MTVLCLLNFTQAEEGNLKSQVITMQSLRAEREPLHNQDENPVDQLKNSVKCNSHLNKSKIAVKNVHKFENVASTASLFSDQQLCALWHLGG